jgi:hypothetical protein
MRRNRFPILAILACAGALAMALASAGYSSSGKGKRAQGDPLCSASPSPVTVGRPFTLRASGLPTSGAVWLIVQTPSGTGSVTQVYVDGDGNWTGTEVASSAGTWTYTFSGLMVNNKYGAVSTCAIGVS